MDETVVDETPVRSTAAEVIVSQEQLSVSSEWHAVGRVRIAKRVVTEERTVTVTVRREELVVEELPYEQGAGDTTPAVPTASPAPVLELVLAEEQVQLVAVPRERVRVFVDRIAGTTHISEVLSHENVEIIGMDDSIPSRDAGSVDTIR